MSKNPTTPNPAASTSADCPACGARLLLVPHVTADKGPACAFVEDDGTVCGEIIKRPPGTRGRYPKYCDKHRELMQRGYQRESARRRRAKT